MFVLSVSRLVQVAVRKNDELTIICRYERAAKSKNERGLVSEARQSERMFVAFPSLSLRCTRFDILSLTRIFFRTATCTSLLCIMICMIEPRACWT